MTSKWTVSIATEKPNRVMWVEDFRSEESARKLYRHTRWIMFGCLGMENARVQLEKDGKVVESSERW